MGYQSSLGSLPGLTDPTRLCFRHFPWNFTISMSQALPCTPELSEGGAPAYLDYYPVSPLSILGRIFRVMPTLHTWTDFLVKCRQLGLDSLWVNPGGPRLLRGPTHTLVMFSLLGGTVLALPPTAVTPLPTFWLTGLGGAAGFHVCRQ